MDEKDNIRETDAFNENGIYNQKIKKRSPSYINLRRRNKFMSVALIVLCSLIIALVALIIVLTLLPSQDEVEMKPKDANVCHTEDCIKTAKYLYENMNLSVDPCDDFYSFSCGGWALRHPRPDDVNVWNVNTLVAKDLNKKIRSILEYKSNLKVPAAVHKARNFYAACTDIEFRDQYGREQLEKVLRKIGGVPLLSIKWRDINYDWESAYVYCDLHLHSMQTLFEYKIKRIDPSDLKNVIELKMPEAYYIAPVLDSAVAENNQSVMEQKQKEISDVIKKVLKDYGSDLDSKQIDKDLVELIKFEKKLYDLSVESSKSDTDGYYKMKLSVLDKDAAGINYSKILNSIFSYINITIPNEEEIWFKNPTYFEKIGRILSATNKRTIANYIGLSVIRGFGDKIIPESSNNETVNEENQKIKCTKLTEKFFRVAINYWFVKEYFGTKMMSELSEFLKQIKNALTLTIQTNKWMDDETQLEAQRKLNSMIEYIASPTEIKDDNDLDSYYKHTGFISSENFPYDYIKMSKWFKHDELPMLREIGNRKVSKPSVVNAFYSPAENKISILIGLLTPPNFYPNSPVSVNMAAIGTTVGHEITHGFDNTGSQFDYKGYQKNWWEERTLEKYKDKVKCFIDQYSEFVEPKSGIKVNGNITSGENIADNGAVHQAFAAYKMYASLKHPEKDLKLPMEMSKFTKDQLFFIGYANTYCNDNSEHVAKLYADDPHPPDVSRVIIPLRNSEEFSKAFNCPVSSRMNPKKKCVLW